MSFPFSFWNKTKTNFITNGLLAWYKMSEGTGSIEQDSSGNENIGTFNNSPTWVSGVPRSPVGNHAIYFNGSSNQSMTTTGVTLSSTWTICFWMFYLTANANYQNLGANGSNNGIYIAGGFFDWYRGNDNKFLTPPVLGSWQHVVITNNATNINGYFNNIIDGNSYTNGLGFIWTTLGSDINLESFDGYIQDYRIYNRVLSSTEISNIYNLKG